MLIRALKTTSGSYGHLPRGKVADVPEYEARELIAAGYAIADLPLAEQEAAPANDNRPLAQSGGLTGADAPRSSSLGDQVPQGLTLDLRADSPELDSSLSTTDTDSAHGQMSSTPATTTGGGRKRGRLRSKG